MGIGDLEFGLKYTFDKLAKLGLQIASGVEVSLPSGDIDRELTEGFIFYEPFIVSDVHPTVYEDTHW